MRQNLKRDKPKQIAIIGGGAGGVFCAIETQRELPDAQVFLFERSNTLLSKVRISGGGRCNVTHGEFDPKQLSQYYPRGGPFLLPLFYRFQPQNMIAWFKKEGVELHKESDGRMFPITNSSDTIISCFLSLLESLEVIVIKNSYITKIAPSNKESKKIEIICRSEEGLVPFPSNFDAVVVATGSTPTSLQLFDDLGISLIPQVPSLFTFNIPSSPFHDLGGVSVEKAAVWLPEVDTKKRAKKIEGPLLITHWGVSGPAILRLSALFARDLFNQKYTTPLHIDWAPSISSQEMTERAYELRKSMAAGRLLKNFPLIDEVPKSIFEALMRLSEISPSQSWINISNSQIARLVTTIKQTILKIEGKTTYKNEFVTAGGVDLIEISPKTMASKKHPWLFFTGEVLNIDGVTGGFNFQAAWTTAWTAARGIATFLNAPLDASPPPAE